MNSRRNFILCTALSLFAIMSAHAQVAFKIGQPAPEFKAGRWLKGGPITQLERGQIYVLEFWATWCGPCRAAMPHLSELARKHAGKVTMIGVNFMERGTPEKVERQVDEFVTQMGKDLDYPNCRDTADDYLRKHWFEPTRSPGIPTTIVVDGAGKIAWIGHPINLDGVLDDLLAGKFDYAKSAAEHSKKTSSNEAMMKVFDAYRAAMEARDWAGAIAVVDNNSEYAGSMWLMRFNALLQLDPQEALGQAREAVAKNERSRGGYLQSIAQTDGLSKELYQFAADALGSSAQGSSYGAMAKLAHRLGDSAKAVEYQLKFREFALNLPQRPAPALMDQIEEDLKLYQGR